MLRFRDSTEAGILLARLIEQVANRESENTVLALRARAVPVAVEVAAALGAPAGLLFHSHGRPRARPVRSVVSGPTAAVALRAVLPVTDRALVLVDDGLEDAARALAALDAVRAWTNRPVIVGVPVADRDAWFTLTHVADRCVCLATPHPFHSVGFWYDCTRPDERAHFPTLRRRHQSRRRRIQKPGWRRFV
jgi:predicted phosphoribosyltransferase